jgi:peptidoglycan hydrolase-like protein with peptidoglycan-binding domain
MGRLAAGDGRLNPDRPARRRRRAVVGALGAAAVAASAVAGGVQIDGGDPARPGDAGTRGGSATAERRTLVDRESVDGTYGYGGSREVVNRLASSSNGNPSRSGNGSGSGDGNGSGGGGSTSNTLTAVARTGSIVGRGGVLYRVDDRPVVLMYGALPAYRTLQTGIRNGPDVLQLEQNLAALGYGSGLTVDRHFSAATATAIERWQRATGLRATGKVEVGRIVFMPGLRRIGSHSADIGATLADGTAVMKTTSTKQLVKVELDVTKQSLVRAGDAVTVTLPSGDDVKGRIRTVGRVAHTPDSSSGSGGSGGGGGGGDGSTDPVIDMTVTLRSARGLRRLDQAPVSVNIARESRRSVLSVPVTALLARAGGGYAVEVIGAGGRREPRPVETGLFAGGYVEIAGGSVRESERVAVPE